MAISDAELNKGSALMLAAGRGLRQAKHTAAKTAEAVTEKTMKYTEEAWKVAEKQMEVAMQHWRTKMGSEWLPGGARAASNAEGRTTSEGLRFGASKNVERPIVLRKRRQRIKSKLNWPLFYFMFDQDHAKPNLIWNLKVRVSCVFVCTR
jgi:DnaJ family protein C protein 13